MTVKTIAGPNHGHLQQVSPHLTLQTAQISIYGVETLHSKFVVVCGSLTPAVLPPAKGSFKQDDYVVYTMTVAPESIMLPGTNKVLGTLEADISQP